MYAVSYAIEDNGTVHYGDVTEYSYAKVAEACYEGSLMTTEADHNFLYTYILKRVDSNAIKVEYAPNGNSTGSEE